jgi:hypothetical protein
MGCSAIEWIDSSLTFSLNKQLISLALSYICLSLNGIVLKDMMNFMWSESVYLLSNTFNSLSVHRM